MLEQNNIPQYHIFTSVLSHPHIKTLANLDDLTSFDENVTESSTWLSCVEIDMAFDHMFTEKKKYDIYRFIAGVFGLSKITFRSGDNECCMISSEHTLRLAAKLLSFDLKDLTSALTVRTTYFGDEREKIRYEGCATIS